MLTNIIKYYIIFFYTIRIGSKILYTLFKPLHFKTIQFILPILFSLLTCIAKNVGIGSIYILSLVMIWILFTKFSLNPSVSLITTILSFGICYSAYIFAYCVSTLLITPFNYKLFNSTSIILIILASLINILLIELLLKHKRFKHGIPFPLSPSFVNVATITVLFLLAFLICRPISTSNFTLKLLTIMLFVIALPILIHWWQAQITKSYRHSVRERELESLRLEVQEKDKQLKELSKKNEQMGHLIHEDTKIIRTFISGLEDYVETDFSEESTRKAKGKELLEVVYEHADERLGTIRNISHKEYATYSTNIETLNLQLNHFSKRASIEDITFHVHIACNLEDYIPKSISTTDLSHLLSNLLDNAFIAASYMETPTIQLQLYEVSNCLVIEIADSGIPFEVESLVSFGLIQRTTHENEGGSGIGLIEIWNLKEKYHATLHIEEYEQPCPYSKKLSLNFNHKNHFSIRTFRKKEIQYASKRIDLQIYE